MHRTIHDIDITTSAMPDEIEDIFEHTIPIGKSMAQSMLFSTMKITK